MNTEDIKVSGETEEVVATNESSEGQKSFKKWEKSRFEFALFVNDFLICKRSFQINGYIEKSMQSVEFKNEVDKMVELINNDLVSKSRIYTWYHLPEFEFSDGSALIPEWEPEIMTEPLIPEGDCVFRFAILDGGKEVISRSWDGRYYPTYVRKNVDLTNRQVKLTRNDKTNIYDKEKFFADHDQLYGELYVLKQMIVDKEDLVPKIQNMIYEVCSSYDGYFEKISDYHTVEEYNNHDFKRDENGNVVYKEATYTDNDGNEVVIKNSDGTPKMVPVLDSKKTKGMKYNFNIDAYNRKIDSNWGAAVAEKTKKHMSELYFSPKEKYFNKKKDVE